MQPALFGALKTVLRSRYAPLHTKHRVYVGAVLPVLLYGCECFTMAEIPRWRRAWMREHDADHPLYDNLTVLVPTNSDGGFFPMHGFYVHLGNMRHSEGSSIHPVDARIRAAHKAFGALGHILRSRWAKPELKGHLFTAVVPPVLLYGSNPWFIDTAVIARITTFYNGRIRSM